MTLRNYLRIIIRSAPAEWTYDDETLSLKSYPEIRIELEHGGQDYRAPWMRPRDGPSPYLYMYNYWYKNQFVSAFPMVQIDPALVVPVPHRTEAGYAITSVQYHLARLVNLERCDLDGYLKERSITIVPAFGVGTTDFPNGLSGRPEFSSITRLRMPPSFRRLLRTRTPRSERR